MASSAINPDTLVTLKVNVEGTNRRFKLPLRDLRANSLPDKLRLLLSIPPTSEAIFERYSDSAADFVTLDPNNVSVYKQLYRAAKAKLKLRLKVTIIDQEDKEPAKPKEATVEDDLPAPVESQHSTPVMPSPPAPLSADMKEALYPSYGEYLKDLTFNFKPAPEVSTAPVASASATPIPAAPTSIPIAVAAVPATTSIPVTRGAAARDKWYAELNCLTEERRDTLRKNRHCPAASMPPQISAYSVYCNNCNSSIPGEHYHCSTCDEGDYDLCQACVEKGILCGGEDHWMIKRFVKHGKVSNSTTETLPPRSIPTNESKATLVEIDEPKEVAADPFTRTCNSCIQEYPEASFITCIDCEDFDLCIPCHEKAQHGHNPKHAFAPAVAETILEPLSQALLDPGRNVSHQAICDGCDKYIYGVRHKCLDCPDWDYCHDCIPNAQFIHPRHRFVPIYEPLTETVCSHARSTLHFGIYCDGPLCTSSSTVIRGDRYKCAVCHDTDFCASCEASPSNLHNKTHPLIKFKTPVRNVSVTTMGDHDNGRPMPIMGDHRPRTTSKSTETTTTASSANAATQVQTVADLQPTETVKVEEVKVNEKIEVDIEKAPKELESEKEIEEPKQELIAHFVRDAVPDGTVLAPGVVFEQTWVLRNGGTTAWPAGCSVKFVGGDNMCAVDPEHPASVHELISAAESTTSYTEVAPGQEHGFTVLMRTPSKAGKVISYWRLTGPDGYKFGHRLWCDVAVEGAAPVAEEDVAEKDVREEIEEEHKSQLIFPAIQKESPISSIHEEAAPVEVPASSPEDEFVDFTSETHAEDDVTEDGFLTDEEYDILDTSDEEYLAEQGKAVKK